MIVVIYTFIMKSYWAFILSVKHLKIGSLLVK